MYTVCVVDFNVEILLKLSFFQPKITRTKKEILEKYSSTFKAIS